MCLMMINFPLLCMIIQRPPQPSAIICCITTIMMYAGAQRKMASVPNCSPRINKVLKKKKKKKNTYVFDTDIVRLGIYSKGRGSRHTYYKFFSTCDANLCLSILVILDQIKHNFGKLDLSSCT